MRFEARTDKLFLIILNIANALLFYAVMSIIFSGVWGVIFGIILILALVVLNSIFFGSTYYLNEKELLIQIWFVKLKIPYDKIKEVKVVKNLWSSLATAYERVSLKTDDGESIFAYTFISPENQEEFVKLLNEKISGLKVEEEVVEPQPVQEVEVEQVEIEEKPKRKRKKE